MFCLRTVPLRPVNHGQPSGTYRYTDYSIGARIPANIQPGSRSTATLQIQEANLVIGTAIKRTSPTALPSERSHHFLVVSLGL